MGPPNDLCSVWLRGAHDGLALWGGLEGRQGGPVPTASLGRWILEGSDGEDFVAAPWKQPEGDHLHLGIPPGLRFPWAAHSFQADSLYFLFYFYCGRNA